MKLQKHTKQINSVNHGFLNAILMAKGAQINLCHVQVLLIV